MLEIFLNKVMFIILMMSILNLLYHTLFFTLSFFSNEKYRVSTRSRILLGLSVSFIMTVIFTGLKLI